MGLYTLPLGNPWPEGLNVSFKVIILALRLKSQSRHTDKITPVSQHKSSAPPGPLPHSPSHHSSTNVGATGTTDYLMLLRLC